MSIALRGNLKDFGIAEVFQLIGQQRKTGLLEITGAGPVFRLVFDAGSVVWASPVGPWEHAALGERLVRCGLMTPERLAELVSQTEASARPFQSLVLAATPITEDELQQVEDLLTHDIIFEVLRWTAGSFHFSAKTVQHGKPPEKLLAAEQILMDGMRMVDEWRTFCDQVPSTDLVFQRTGGLDSYRQQVQGDARARMPQAERVFPLIDGRLSVQRVIDLSRLGTFDGTRVLAELRAAGLIAPIEGPSVRPEPVARSWSPAPLIRGVLAAAFPIALLSCLVFLTFQPAGAPVPERALFPIVRSPLADAQRSFEARALRHALEADRYLSGKWPDSLSEPDRSGLLGRATLAPTDGRPYYYAHRERGVILLAPKH